MKISLCQMEIIRGAQEKNIKSAEISIKKAAAGGCDLILLPEFWAVGFDLAHIDSLADKDGEGVFAFMADFADRYNIAVCGTHPQRRADKIYNTAVFFDRNGKLLSSYDKMHLFSLMKEDIYITAGQILPSIFETEWGSLGIITCFDLRFPEMVRRLALDGADLILIPAYWPQPRLDHWAVLLKARAIENQLYVAGCNRCKEPEGLEFGKSALISPDGFEIIQAGLDQVLLTADLDISDVQQSRKHFPAFLSRKDGNYGSF